MFRQLVVLERTLDRHYQNPNNVTAYESLCDTLCLEKNHNSPQAYFKNLYALCEQIPQLSPQLRPHLSEQQVVKLDATITGLKIACQHEISLLAMPVQTTRGNTNRHAA
jgi:hypothetical protein